MRWFVDISSIGASGGKASRFCVEAEQWQRALQSVRALRGDTSPFSNFSIELLEDGYRAIDPATRTRYVVQKAPDGTELTTQPIEVPALPSSPPPASIRPRPSSRGERIADRAKRQRSVAIPDDPVPRASAVPSIATPTAESAPPSGASSPVSSAPPRPPPAEHHDAPAPKSTNGSVAPASIPRPSSAPQPSTPIARPMQAETAFERMTEGLASFPLTTKEGQAPDQADGPATSQSPRSQDVNTEILPRFRILAERAESPTPSSPLNYREMVFAVAESTSTGDAEAIVRAQFEVVKASLSGAPKGQFITLAVFDHEFEGKPRRLPIATLSFKDWRDAEPVVRFPLRDVRTSTNAPPPSSSSGGRFEIEPAPETKVNPTTEVPIDARRSDDALPRAELPRESTMSAAPEAVRNPAPTGPTPSEIQRAAAEMGADEKTLVKESSEAGAKEVEVDLDDEPEVPTQARPAIPGIPLPPDSLTQVIPPPTLPSEGGAEVAPSNVASETPTPAISSGFVPVTPTAPMPAVAPSAAPFDPTARGSFKSVPPAAAGGLPRLEPVVATQVLRAVESQPPPAAPAPAAMQSQPPPAAPAPAPVQSQPPPAPVQSQPPPAPVQSQPPPAPTVQSQPPIAIHSQPPPAHLDSQPPMSKRVGGDDLIVELFEALSDLQFISDPLEGAAFVLGVALENLPSEVGFVSFFSLDSREFVVVRTSPNAPPGLALKRASERSSLAERAMRARQPVVVSQGAAEAVADDPRWQAAGIVPMCVLCAPVNLGGRYLGLIEMANPIDGAPYTEADGNAIAYISTQFGEFLGQREVILDPERISAPPLHARVRRV